jgi:hypothetical protein
MHDLLFAGSVPNSARWTLRFLIAVLVLGSCVFSLGNDSAIEFAAGGIQLRREPRISMEKERLTLSLNKVGVEYEFLNVSDEDITTEVAFPIPPYKFDPFSGRRDFSDFRVWIDGEELKYQTEVRAEVKGVNYASLLRRLGISVLDFGTYDVDAPTDKSQIGTLPKPEKEKLVRLGLIETDGLPDWTTSVTHYWSQRFPAHKSLHVRHEYTPMWGYCPTNELEFPSVVKAACIGASLLKRLGEFPRQDLEAHGGIRPTREAEWVKYILTTANTWKTPIKVFELVIAEPEAGLSDPQYVGVSLCWDGELRRVDKNHLMARKVNFIPKSDLVVCYFVDYYQTRLDKQLKWAEQ